ncbi:MAG TPA: hypothetical protein PKB06_01515, partial [Actinotalea sp.]|nr:hypothetical protein [Actinotalea sp.]
MVPLPSEEDDVAVGEERSVGAPPGARSARGRATGSGWYLAAVAAMVVVAAGAGIAGTGTYGGMPPLLRETWRAQDMVN